MTRAELDDALAAVRMALPPPHVTTRLNGEPLPARAPVCHAKAHLPTEVADEGGALTRRTRLTSLHLHRPLEGETPTLYEMGLPVMPTCDEYHVDVQQKIPLSMDRDGVSPAYLRAVRTAVLNAAHPLLGDDNARRAWVRDALSDPRCSAAAVKRVVEARFGSRAVVFDPSDREANSLAASKGYTVVHGGTLTKGEWANVKAAQALLPAGQATPTPKVFGDEPVRPRCGCASALPGTTPNAIASPPLNGSPGN